jgi:hypothetical protein
MGPERPFKRYLGVVYRKPIHPKVDRWERRQTLAARWTGFAVMAIIAAGMLGLADWTLPPQNLPWKPLSPADPVGLATHVKVAAASGDACRALLSQHGVSYQNVPDSTDGAFCAVHDALLVSGGTAALHPIGAVMTCREALAFAVWERQVVQPAAMETLGASVSVIDHFGSYQCRRMYGQTAGDISQHALANAIDVGGFELADGTKVTVADDWNDPGPKGVFLHRVRQGACGVFSVVLSPDYNDAHKNHLHLDMSPNRLGVVGPDWFCH